MVYNNQYHQIENMQISFPVSSKEIVPSTQIIG